MLKGNHNSTEYVDSYLKFPLFLFHFTFISDSSSMNKTNGMERNLEMEMVDGSKCTKAVVAQAEVGIPSFCSHMKS